MAPVNRRSIAKTYGKKPGRASIFSQAFNNTFDQLFAPKVNIFESSSEREANSNRSAGLADRDPSDAQQRLDGTPAHCNSIISEARNFEEYKPYSFHASVEEVSLSVPKELKEKQRSKARKENSVQKKTKQSQKRKRKVNLENFIKTKQPRKRKGILKLEKLVNEICEEKHAVYNKLITPSKLFDKVAKSTPKKIESFVGNTPKANYRKGIEGSPWGQVWVANDDNLLLFEAPSAIGSFESWTNDSVSEIADSFLDLKLKAANIRVPPEERDLLALLPRRAFSNPDSLVRPTDSFQFLAVSKKKGSLDIRDSFKPDSSIPPSRKGENELNQSVSDIFFQDLSINSGEEAAVNEGDISPISTPVKETSPRHSQYSGVTFRKKRSNSDQIKTQDDTVYSPRLSGGNEVPVVSPPNLSSDKMQESAPSSINPDLYNDDAISSDGSSDSSNAYQDASEESLESSDHLSCPPISEKKLLMKTRSASCDLPSVGGAAGGESSPVRPPIRRQMSDQSQFSSRLDSTLSTVKMRSQRRAQESAQKTRRMKKYQSEGSLLYKNKKSTLEFQKSRHSWQVIDDSPSPPSSRPAADRPLPSLLEIHEHSGLGDDESTSGSSQDRGNFYGFTSSNVAKSRKTYIIRRSEISLDYSLPVVKEDDKLELAGNGDDDSSSSQEPFKGFNNQSVAKTRKRYNRRPEIAHLDCSLPVVKEDDKLELTGESSCDDTMDDTSRASSSRQESPTSANDFVAPLNGNEKTSSESPVDDKPTSPTSDPSPQEKAQATAESPDSSRHGSPSKAKSNELKRQESESPVSSRHGSPTSPVTRETASSSEDESGSSPVRHKEMSPRRSDRRQSRPSRLSKRTLGYIAEESESESALSEIDELPTQDQFYLIPGKRYRRSLSIFHQLIDDKLNCTMTMGSAEKGRRYQESVDEVIKLQGKSEKRVRQSLCYLSPRVEVRRVERRSNVTNAAAAQRRSTSFPVKDTTLLNDLIHSTTVTVVNFDRSQSISLGGEHLRAPSLLPDNEEDLTYEDVVKNLCNQVEPCSFDEVLREDINSCRKIGEGVYGEVFSINRRDESSVLKVIPIEGEMRVNGEAQKTYDEVFSELVITNQTSGLHTRDDFRCNGFVRLINCWIVVGAYPTQLIDLWKEFDYKNGSDNDCPTIFPENQLYLVLELANVGQNLEEYKFSSAKQGFSAFKQVVYSLAVAESAFEFEHRDLHWGNILISRTAQKVFHYALDSETFEVKTNGVKASIIDYTLSRMTCGEGFQIFNDLSKDPDIFTGKGDLQFEVYRQMKSDLDNDWSRFVAKTNVRWLHYLLDKLIERAHYQRKQAGVHLYSITVMKEIRSWIQDCDTALQVALKITNFK